MMTAGQLFQILIVDDNPINLKLLDTTLAKDGYHVITATNGPAAREIALVEKPHLILLDIKMPEEDGFQVIQKLKENPATTTIPVIFLTGVSDIGTKLHGFELGAVDYITKPFHPREVLARVRLHLKLSIATNSLIAGQAQKLKQITEAQTSMLVTPDMVPQARFGVYYSALQEAGGDFYEVTPISDEIFGYFVADFSGHDIQTSYLTASVKALLKQNSAPVYQAHESMQMINDVLVEILPEGKYLTACYARLNRKTKQMTIVSAGHPPVIFVPLEGKAVRVDMQGDILGIFKEVYFGSHTMDVNSGDRFYLYSDGLIESSKDKTLWSAGSKKLLAACEDAGSVSIQEAPRHIVQLLSDKDVPIEDDVVVLGVEV
ncbi:MAG: fused response regulator/phosphatase [Pseudomonadota bacterium]